ncbi:hypothetical protein FB451DRAFT_1559557 [Mycena latifolia]|nr:hypothetical protein FB451DRAFT_1559557 [Mycena latifolia]
MPRRYPNVLQHAQAAADTLDNVSSTLGIPFLSTIAAISSSLIPMVQDTKANKERCFDMVEKVHKLLCVITIFCINSKDSLSPQTLGHLGHFAHTLQTFHACLRSQQDLGKIRRFFKQSEITAQLEGCERELEVALNVFMLQSGVGITTALADLSIDTERMHQEFLELVSAQSGSIYSETKSSTRRSFLQHSNSSSALSLLPSSPKIFHGRESELASVISTLLCDPARGAVLGAGGMGKTTLATAALHHPTIIEKYAHRHFISCESANNSVDLVSIVGSHLGIEPSRQLAKAIVRHLAECGTSLVVLDNLETPWEPSESRGEVEEFLSLLADVSTLSLLITMRGAERPGKVKWTRPFLPPLAPLSPSASRHIFSAVTDDHGIGDEAALDELLELSGNLPLAVSLLASVASIEGYTGALARWKIETTAVVSDGYDKRSNLEQSIRLSLGSPRISSSPHAQDLLALLSLLPDGIAEEDLAISNVPIPDIAQCRFSLVRTSLAYMDANRRFKALSPIREYMRKANPPSSSLSRPLRIYFQALLEVWKSHQQLSSRDLVPKISSYLGNISDLMVAGLVDEEPAACLEIADSILTLNRFSIIMVKGVNPLIHQIPRVIKLTGNSRLRWSYAASRLEWSSWLVTATEAEILISQGVEYFKTGNKPVEQAIMFLNAAASYYLRTRNNKKAEEFADLALSLAPETADIELKLSTLRIKANISQRAQAYHELIRYVHAAEKIGRLSSNFPDESNWIAQEARANCALGNLPRAIELCEQAYDLLVATGSEGASGQLDIMDIQAEIHLNKSEYVQARKLHQSAAGMTSPTCSPFFHANSLVNLAYLDILLGHGEAEILQNLDSARRIYAAHGNQRHHLCDAVTARLYLRRGDTEMARSSFEQCLFKSRAIYKDIVMFCLSVLGDPRHGLCSPRDTFRWAVVYFSFIRKLKHLPDTFHALRCLADAHADAGDDETALDLFHAALEGATEMDAHRLRAECMMGIGDIILRRGDLAQARKMWQAARPLFYRASQMNDVEKIDTRIALL